MAVFDPYLKSTVTVGPPIVLNDLLVYYDISNPNCFTPGTRRVNNLSPASPGSRITFGTGTAPFYDPVYPQALIFDGVNDFGAYNVNLSNPGAPFTAIVIAKSNTATWSWSGDYPGNSAPYDYADIVASYGVGGTSGFSLAGGPAAGARALGNVYPNFTGGNRLADSTDACVPITRPCFYAISTDGSTSSKYYVAGVLKDTKGNPGTRNTGAITVYLGCGNQTEYPGTRFSAVTIFAHFLYGRQLTDTEILNNYNALKQKYNLI